MEGQATLDLPQDPALADVAVALRDAGHWAEIVDPAWRLVYSTDDLRRIYGGLTELAPVALGVHYFGPEAMRVRLTWRSGPNRLELIREMFGVFGGMANRFGSVGEVAWSLDGSRLVRQQLPYSIPAAAEPRTPRNL